VKTIEIAEILWRNTDSVTKWIQVAALVFAAAWTFWTFREKEAPSLETPARVSVEIREKWHQEPTPGYCWVSAVFSVADQGVKSFDVASVEVSTWRINLPTTQTSPFFIDIPAFEKNKPLATLHPSSGLIGRYAPKTDLHDAIEWIFYGQPSTDLFLTRIEVFDKSNKSLGQASAWDQICR
jgi:hypothetical protein